jgi:hypothetical protein
MSISLTLLPAPRKLELHAGQLTFQPACLILLDCPQPQDLLFTARQAQQALRSCLDLDWQLTTTWAVPSQEIGLTLRLAPQAVPQAQGYRLAVAPQDITIQGHDKAGLFYGVCTLKQLLTHTAGGSLPCLQITDWPDFPARGVMLDISRDRVPTLQTLFELVDRLASWKINQLQLYIEHTFAYRSHPEVWQSASPMTGDEILALDNYCRQRFIELVPNQNSLGHLTHWLKLPRYAPLAEIHGAFQVPWGISQGPFSLAPANPGSLEFVRSLYDELLPHFTSRMVNVGLDETFHVGKGQSKELCAELGVHRVYLDFLLKVYQEVSRRGFKMQFWGDIIVEAPDLIPELPRDVIGLVWGYDADHPFDKQGRRFKQAGVPFYVCPGTSSWNSIAGRTDNALANLHNAAENGLKYGAIGFLNTDWGDNGHWQSLPVSYLGFAVGAAYAWCLKTNQEMDVPKILSRYAFEDPSGMMGQLAFDLGNIYQAAGVVIHNASALFGVLQLPLEAIAENPNARIEVFSYSLEVLARIAAHLGEDRMQRPDAILVRREFALAVRMLRHACQRGLLALEVDPARAAPLRGILAKDLDGILNEYQSVWLARCRPGGLKESLAHFQAYN